MFTSAKIECFTLVQYVAWHGSCREEIRSRISVSKRACKKVLLTTARIPLAMRKMFAKCLTLNVMLYGSETWTNKKSRQVAKKL